MTLKIGIITDSIEIGPTSIGNYTRNLVKELLEIKDDNVEIILIHGQESDNPIYKKAEEVIIPPPKAKKHKYFVVKLFYFLFRQWQDFYRNYKIKKVCEKNEMDILHIPHLAGALAPSLAYLNRQFRLVITLHGVAPLVVPPEIYYESKAYSQRMFTQIEVFKWKFFYKNRFEQMIAVSESEKKNIAQKLNINRNKIMSIHLGVDNENFREIEDKNKILEDLHKRYGLKGNFILHISAYSSRKNGKRIIKAFAIIKNDENFKGKLILIGTGFDLLKSVINELNLKKDIIILGHIPYNDLPKFLNLAELFIFPSFYEGFGMPITEAMACGCPVITSNVTACPEVAGDAAILVNPYNTEEIAEAISKILSDEKLREELKQKGLK